MLTRTLRDGQREMIRTNKSEDVKHAQCSQT